MKTTPWYPLLLGFAILLLAFGGSANAAEDDKTFPGTLCKSRFSSDSTQNLGGRKFNTAPSDQVWTCPIVRDVLRTEPPAATVKFARVTVINWHPGQTLTCRLVGRTKAGAIHNSEFRSIAGSRDAAPQDLVFGAGDDDTVVGFDDDYYAFECDIPGMAEGQASGVVSYRITEQDTFVD